MDTLGMDPKRYREAIESWPKKRRGKPARKPKKSGRTSNLKTEKDVKELLRMVTETKEPSYRISRKFGIGHRTLMDLVIDRLGRDFYDERFPSHRKGIR